MPWSSSLAYTGAGASSTCSSESRTRCSSVRSASDSARGCAAGGNSRPGPHPALYTPSACPPPAPARRRPGRSSRLALYRGAVGGELLQQRREFSLVLDHLAGLAELTGQALVLLAQPVDLPVAGIGGLASGRLGQRLERAAVALPAPLRQQRRVQALAPEQRALAGLVEALVLLEDLRLVLRRVPARATGALGHLGVRIGGLVRGARPGARIQRMIACHGHRGTPPRPLSPMMQQLYLPHWMLTQRGIG